MVPLRDICAGEGVRVVGADVGRDVWLRIGWVVGLLVGLFDETDDDVKFGLGVGFWAWLGWELVTLVVGFVDGILAGLADDWEVIVFFVGDDVGDGGGFMVVVPSEARVGANGGEVVVPVWMGCEDCPIKLGFVVMMVEGTRLELTEELNVALGAKEGARLVGWIMTCVPVSIL
jgi:hypothetical protein